MLQWFRGGGVTSCRGVRLKRVYITMNKRVYVTVVQGRGWGVTSCSGVRPETEAAFTFAPASKRISAMWGEAS